MTDSRPTCETCPHCSDRSCATCRELRTLAAGVGAQKNPGAYSDALGCWLWSEEEIEYLRAACAKRFGETLRTESLFAIATAGMNIASYRALAEDHTNAPR